MPLAIAPRSPPRSLLLPTSTATLASDFHPETWVPAWSVGTILNGILSFMLESTPTVGSVETTLSQKRLLAKQSHTHNRNNPIFKMLFPELVQPAQEGEEGDAARAAAPVETAPMAGPNGIVHSIVRRPSIWIVLWMAVVAIAVAFSRL